MTPTELAVTILGACAIIGELWYFLAPRRDRPERQTTAASDGAPHAHPSIGSSVPTSDDG